MIKILRKHKTKCWVVGWEGTKVQIEAYKVIILETREGFEWENVVFEAIESEVWVWVKFQVPLPKQCDMSYLGLSDTHKDDFIKMVRKMCQYVKNMFL